MTVVAVHSSNSHLEMHLFVYVIKVTKRSFFLFVCQDSHVCEHHIRLAMERERDGKYTDEQGLKELLYYRVASLNRVCQIHRETQLLQEQEITDARVRVTLRHCETD